MKYVVNIEDRIPDQCERSLRFATKDRTAKTLRDTYFLIDPASSPSRRLKMGLTVVYADGKTTGHAHEDQEEVYFVLQGKGKMIVGDAEYEIKTGDALHVPFGEFHVTHNTGVMPLQLLWVSGGDDET